jgi:hypothetical protein
MRNFFSAFLLLPLLLSLGGCGYHVGEIKPTPMRRVTTIAVNSFKNETLIPRVEVQTANAVVKQFQQDGTYRIESNDRADAILEGAIEKIDRQPMRIIASNVLQTSEFELQQGKARGTTPFFTDSNLVNSDLVTDQNMNYPSAAQRMAENLVSKVSEGW